MKQILNILVVFLLFITSCQDKKDDEDKNVNIETVKKNIQKTVKVNQEKIQQKQKEYNKKEVDSIRQQLSANDTALFFIQKNFDLYFYVSRDRIPQNINWKDKEFKMGIVNKVSKVIVPIKYDLIFSLQNKDFFVTENNQKFNLYDFNGKKYFQEEVDGIYPVGYMKNVVCQFKKNGNYGWLATDGTIHYIENKGKYPELTKPPTLNGKINAWKLTYGDFLKIPDKRYRGEEIYITPSWFREYGIKIIYSDHWTNHEMSITIDSTSSINTDYKIIDVVMEGTVDGGSDLATSEYHCLNLIDIHGKINKQINIPNQFYFKYSDFNWRVIGDTLLETKYGIDSSEYIVAWKYYQFNDKNELVELHSNRLYPFTHFTIMDSNYPKAHYYVEDDYDDALSKEEYQMATQMGSYTYYNGFSGEEYDYMRNEIFASYGYKFKSKKWQKIFSEFDWYKPLFDNVDDSLTDIERENIQYLQKQ